MTAPMPDTTTRMDRVVNPERRKAMLGRVYTLILSFGERQEIADQCEAAEVRKPPTVGDTLAAKPKNQ